jgi:hypothetical protein
VRDITTLKCSATIKSAKKILSANLKSASAFGDPLTASRRYGEIMNASTLKRGKFTALIFGHVQ